MIDRKQQAALSAGFMLALVLATWGIFSATPGATSEEYAPSITPGDIEPAPPEPTPQEHPGHGPVCERVSTPPGLVDDALRRVTKNLETPNEIPADIDDVCALVDEIERLLRCDSECKPLLDVLMELLEKLLDQAGMQVDMLLEGLGLPADDDPLGEAVLPQTPMDLQGATDHRLPGDLEPLAVPAGPVEDDIHPAQETPAAEIPEHQDQQGTLGTLDETVQEPAPGPLTTDTVDATSWLPGTPSIPTGPEAPVTEGADNPIIADDPDTLDPLE